MTSLAARRVLVASSRGARIARKEFSSLVSIEHEFPELPATNPQPKKATSVSVTTLSNGLTVVTENVCNTSTVTLTYPKAGSAGEHLDEQGAAYMNKCLNFKSGSGLSTLLINRTIEDAGGVMFTTVDRKAATVGFTVSPDRAIGLVPLLATDCSFERWDFRDAAAVAATESQVAGKSAQIVLTENLMAAAYGPQSPAGRPVYSTGCPVDTVVAFRSRTYGLKGAVLTATGVSNHAAFCREAESLLSDSPLGSSESPAKITYIGGESRVGIPHTGYAHVAIGFQAPASSIVTNVVKHIFSILGAPNGVSGFSTTGLVGIYAGTSSPGTVVDALTKSATSSLSSEIVKRAKALAKAEALFALDGGTKSLAAAMTASFLEGALFASPADVSKAYDAVTEAQVKEAVAVMRKGNPSIAAVGDIAAVPYHFTVAANLK